MNSSGFGKPKTYDRLQIPNFNVEKRRTTGTDYLDALRTGEGLRSQTLKYSFDFQRPANSRGRLSVIPGIVSVPNVPQRDARTGGAPAGAPGMRAASGKPVANTSVHGLGQVPSQSKSPKAQVSTPRRGAASAKQHGAAGRGEARPSAQSVVDFRGAAGGIQAPRLKDSMEALGLPSKKQTEKTKDGAQTAAGRKKNKTAKGTAKSAKPPKPRPQPNPPSEKTIRKQQKLRGLSESEPTVVGFDISRSVYQRAVAEEAPQAEAKAVEKRTKGDQQVWKSTLSWVFVIVSVFFLMAFSLSMQAQESDVTRQNAELEKSIESLKGEVSKAQMKVALNEDLSNVKERAESLGLEPPADEQIEYVDLGFENTYEEQAQPPTQIVSSGDH